MAVLRGVCKYRIPGPKRRCNRRLGPVVKENLCKVVSIVHKNRKKNVPRASPRHHPHPCRSSRVCVVVSVVVGGAGGAGDAGDEGVFRGWPFVVVVVLEIGRAHV